MCNHEDILHSDVDFEIDTFANLHDNPDYAPSEMETGSDVESVLQNLLMNRVQWMKMEMLLVSLWNLNS